LLLLTGDEIHELLRGRETEILETVKLAYMTCDRGNAVMPDNSYLRFPGKEKERIIAKIAYLGEGFEAAGIKWISSFPENIARNIERASAALILNSVETGRPTAVLEGSIISAKRTAASAALAAACLWQQQEVWSVGLIGCGLINFETLRFLVSCFPGISQASLYDLSPDRARQFQARVSRSWPALKTRLGSSFEETVDQSQILSLATTAVTPHVESLQYGDDERLILHLSVRDLAPEIILEADNVVDDVDQVCSNATSLHLAEGQVGHRGFIRCTLGEVLNGCAPARAENSRATIFTPFGLGALDVAVGELARSLALRDGAGQEIPGFFPKAWSER
jgi:ornithine cyclodeaminase